MFLFIRKEVLKSLKYIIVPVSVAAQSKANTIFIMTKSYMKEKRLVPLVYVTENACSTFKINFVSYHNPS